MEGDELRALSDSSASHCVDKRVVMGQNARQSICHGGCNVVLCVNFRWCVEDVVEVEDKIQNLFSLQLYVTRGDR